MDVRELLREVRLVAEDPPGRGITAGDEPAGLPRIPVQQCAISPPVPGRLWP